ncbi:MAG: hypothetical protein H8D80_02625 [Proteobacteria bacterium]|nr:hypothetical protein [Pseudomonadota bacterium]
MSLLDLSNLKTYWINLDEKTDRKETMENLFDELGIKNHERVSAVKAQPYYYGCGMSHIKTLEMGLATGKPFLVLEDDVAHTDGFTKTLDVPEDVDAVYLGYTVWSDDKDRSLMSRMTNPLEVKQHDDNFVKISYMTSLHAVLYMTEEYVKGCIESMTDWVQNKDWHCDVATAEIQKDFNVVLPLGEAWFYQNDPRNIPWTKVGFNKEPVS